MKSRLLHITVILLPLVLLSCTARPKVINYDVSFVYHPEKTLAKSKTLEEKDSLHIYVSLFNPVLFEKTGAKDFLNNFSLVYRLVPEHYSFSAYFQDSLTARNLDVFKFENTFYLSFHIPKIPKVSKAILILQRYDAPRKRMETTDIFVDYTLHENGRNYILFDRTTEHPVLENYIGIEDTVKIVSGISREVDSLFITHYSEEFLPAPPPHKVADSGETERINAHSFYRFKINQTASFHEQGLYFLKNKESNDEGVSVLVKGNKYPHISTYEEMIDPLIYITNKTDFNRIKNAENPKSALDSFWLNIGGSKEYSRAMIKSYYEKVEYTNKVFTSYKEGWKTDRGMIYIIFGKPDQVYKYLDAEEWYYENILANLVSFTFSNKKNKFTADNYELVRNPHYERFWYAAIEKWRNGIITK